MKSEERFEMILTVTANAAIDKRYVGALWHRKCESCEVLCRQCGRKGINVSRVASLLGTDITATGFLGGHAGRFISSVP